MREVSVLVTMLLAMCAIVIYISWAVHDAKRRRKHPLLVVIAVAFFFPFGLLAWILFRPAVVGTDERSARRRSHVNPLRGYRASGQ